MRAQPAVLCWRTRVCWQFLPPGSARHNLPLELNPLIGRDSDEHDVRELLGTCRLLTLTGAGGVGKTRLALAVARGAVAAYEDGVWLVELASLSDPGLVAHALAMDACCSW
jgi:hypothetical protein